MAEPLIDPETMRRLEQLTLISRKLSAGRLKGERRSRRRGSSTDFADYRNYAPGDDLRFLDWKIYGRLERLFIKLFQEEEDLHVHLFVDCSPSMTFGSPQKLRFALQTAAAIGYLSLARMDSVNIYMFGERVVSRYGPKRGKRNGASLIEFLQRPHASEGTELSEVFRGFAGSGRGRGMVVILSDFYDATGFEDGLRRLVTANQEVLAIHVLSPEELKPTHEGDLRLVDAEIGQATDVSMGPALQQLYERTLQAFCGELRDYIVKRGGHYLLTSSDTPFDRLVLDVLRRRGVVR